MRSLRARLLIAVVSVTLLIWTVTAALAYREARHEAADMLDAQLAQSARLLLQRVTYEAMMAEEEEEEDEGEGEGEDELTEATEPDDFHPYVQDQSFAIWRLPGHVFLRSELAPVMTLQATTGYSDMVDAGHSWRVLSLRDQDQHYQVQVAQRTDARDQAALEVALRVAGPMAIALPLLIGFLYLAVRRGLAPLDTLAGEVAARAPDALAPLTSDAAPSEARPLVDALNDLLARLASTLENERRFTADAAHELRTPLAALKVQAQVARLSADPEARGHALDQVLVGVDRATHLVEELLRLARLDPLSGVAQARQLSAAELLQAAGEAWAPAARAKGVALDIVAGDVEITGDPELLGLALRNLIENAVRHTPADGQVEVGCERAAGGVRLWVRDTGPGVAEPDLPRLAERFFRGQAVSGEGCGLGLALVQRIATLHGAGLALANRPGGGFEAALIFPA